jgi:hypothetical protein
MWDLGLPGQDVFVALQQNSFKPALFLEIQRYRAMKYIVFRDTPNGSSNIQINWLWTEAKTVSRV